MKWIRLTNGSERDVQVINEDNNRTTDNYSYDWLYVLENKKHNVVRSACV